tara:strand:- start:403 stop:2364 length:1962 start_codon:yes stop_codon:yes gene_type:complete
MVTQNTASEIDDIIIAKLAEPYKKAVQVLAWDIQAGFSNEFTVGKLTFLQGSEIVEGIGTNLDLNPGDIILAAGYEFEVLETPDQNTVILTAPSLVNLDNVEFHIKANQWNYFEYYFRWSQNDVIEKGGEHAEWHPLNQTSLLGDLLSLNFDPMSPLWIEIKAKVIDLQPFHTISFLKATYTIQYENGIIEECPQTCIDCEPYDVIGCANILVDCEAENLYDPYSLSRPVKTYESLSNLANSVWGHPVTYYRVEPNVRSSDVILKEYSLYDVIDKATLKIMVPDNEFPTETPNFDIFGMGFEGFEIHLLGSEFRKYFGENKSPRARDYLFIPYNNRMYEVDSVSLADEFNKELTYYRLFLKKFENRTSTQKGDFAEDLTDLITGVDEVFGEETQDEFDKVTKPLQYQSTHHMSQDGVRKFVHKMLEIKDVNLMNKWTVISRNYYDLSTVLGDPSQAPAVIYEEMSKNKIEDNLAVTFWFQPSPSFDFTQEVYYDTLDGNDIEGNGMIIKISRRFVMVRINNQDYEFDHSMILSTGEWYCLVVNMSNTYNEVSANIFSLDDQANFTNPTGPMELENAYFGKLDMLSPQAWETEVNWSLRPSEFYITNLRVFTKTIEEEAKIPILHRYVVRDAQHLLIADNAIPSLQLQTYTQVR